MKRSFFLFSCLIGLTVSYTGIFAQAYDSTRLEGLRQLAFGLSVNRNYDSSDYYLNIILNNVSFGSKEYWLAKIRMVDNLISRRRIAAADSLNRLLQEEVNLYFGNDSNNYLAGIVYRAGKIIERQGNLAEAEKLYLEAISIYRTNDSTSEDVGNALNSLGINYARRGYFVLAGDYLSEALGIFRAKDSLSTRVGALHNNLGNLFNLQDKRQRALIHYLSSLEVKKKALGNEYHPNLALTYFNIADLYFDTRQNLLAAEYLKKSIRIKESTPDLQSELHSEYAFMAQILSTSRQDSLARYYLRKAERLVRSTPESTLRNQAEIEFAFGFFYHGIFNYSKAKEYYEKSLATYTKIREESLDNIARLKLNLGLMNYHLGNSDSAYSLIEESTALLHAYYGDHAESLAKAYRWLSFMNQKKGSLSSALSAIQKSIEASTDKNGERLNLVDVENKIELIFSLAQQGALMTQQFEENEKVENLYLAKHSFQLCDSLIGTVNKSVQYIDQLNLIDSVNFVYDKAIKVDYLLHKETGDLSHMQEAFYYASQGKGTLFSQRLRKLNQDKFKNIPQYLISKEAELNEDISFFEIELMQERNNDNPDVSLITVYEDKLLESRASLDSLIRLYNDSYPGYFNLLYGINIVELSEVQNMLGEETQLIQFVSTPEEKFIFSLDSDTIIFDRIEYSKDHMQDLEKFIGIIQNSNGVHQGELFKFGERLYEHLFSALDDLKKNLVIIPDESLIQLPFGLLILPKNSSDKSSEYLLSAHNVNYLHNPFQLLPTVKAKKKSSLNILALAAGFDDVSNGKRGENNGLTKLRWTDEEVESINSVFNSTILKKHEATEKNFRNSLPNKDIIHLASHALIHDEQAFFSKIAFEQDSTDMNNDNYLHVYELFNMSINSSLVVLSACRTGDGKLYRGEGTLSLAKGFEYAGVPSVVMSKWQVDDQSTSELMQFFYKNLKAGMTKSEALRQAKLEFLETAPPEKQHPFYWGAFVVIGDDKPIYRRSYSAIAIPGVMLLFLILLWFTGHLRKKSI